jgi:hypothetical protein
MLSIEETEKIQQCLDEMLVGKLYDDNKSAQLINDILEKSMELLVSFKKPYKYIVDCYLSQRVGAGLTNFTSAYYDRALDNVYHFYYPKDKTAGGKDKPLILAVLTIFIVSYAK